MPTFMRSSGDHNTAVNLDLVKNIRQEIIDGKQTITFVFDPSFILEWSYIDQEHFENDVRRLRENFFI
ncbi:MAG TPA: hypothetical protein VGC22_13430 [Chitinophaga sp.]